MQNFPGLHRLSFTCGQELDRTRPQNRIHWKTGTRGFLLLFFGEEKWEACSCRITEPFQILCKLPSPDLSLSSQRRPQKPPLLDTWYV